MDATRVARRDNVLAVLEHVRVVRLVDGERAHVGAIQADLVVDHSPEIATACADTSSVALNASPDVQSTPDHDQDPAHVGVFTLRTFKSGEIIFVDHALAYAPMHPAEQPVKSDVDLAVQIIKRHNITHPTEIGWIDNPKMVMVTPRPVNEVIVRTALQENLPLKQLRVWMRMLNRFTVVGASFLGKRSFSRSVFEIVSRLNHSCSPNAICIFNSDGSIAQVMALRTIEEGDEVTIAYWSEVLAETMPVRRAIINDKQDWQCGCQRCRLEEIPFLQLQARGIESFPNGVPIFPSLNRMPDKAKDGFNLSIQYYYHVILQPTLSERRWLNDQTWARYRHGYTSSAGRVLATPFAIAAFKVCAVHGALDGEEHAGFAWLSSYRVLQAFEYDVEEERAWYVLPEVGPSSSGSMCPNNGSTSSNNKMPVAAISYEVHYQEFLKRVLNRDRRTLIQRALLEMIRALTRLQGTMDANSFLAVALLGYALIDSCCVHLCLNPETSVYQHASDLLLLHKQQHRALLQTVSNTSHRMQDL